MNIIKKTALFIASSMLSLPLTAQETEQTDEAEMLVLDEIIVFAQKRAQILEDVPIATTVIDQEGLETSSVSGPSDLYRVVPNLSFGDSVTSRARSTFIRGLGTQSFSDGVETSVGTFVDGVAMGRDFMGFNEFNDITQVEVLRGPQGTLYGKNTSAGLINIITENPLFQPSWRVNASYGEDSESKVNGTYTNALSKSVAGRISFYHSERDGIIENLLLQRETNEKSGSGIKAKLLFTPNDNLEIVAAADYQVNDEDCCEVTFRSLPTPAPALPASLGALTAFGAVSLSGFDPQQVADKRVSVNNQVTGEEIDNYGATLTVNYELEKHRIVSISAYRSGEIFESNGADGVPLSFLDIASTDSESTQFSQELRLETLGNSETLSYVIGAYYFDNEVESLQRFEGVDLVAFGLLPGIPLASQVTRHGSDAKNYAFFGQMSYNLSDQFSTSFGLRYSKDDVSGYVDRQSTINAFPTGGPFTSEAEEGEISGKLSLEYSYADDDLIYLSYSRGYKGPATQVDPLFNAAPGTSLPTVAPELVDLVEFGLRGTLANQTLRYGLTLFQTDVEDLQAASFDPSRLSFLLQNVGEARTRGVELEFGWQPTERFSVSGFLAHLDGEILSFPGAACYPGQSVGEGCNMGLQDLSGSDLPNAPQNTARFSVTYEWDKFAANLGYSWRDDVQYSLNGNPRTIQESYGLMDATLSYQLNDTWTLSFYGQNLTDEQYAPFIANSLYTTFLSGVSGDTSTVQILGRGRSAGVRLSGAL